MDYKKIIKDRNTRLKILRLFDWIPNKTMIKLQYRIRMGRKLNLKNPQRFTEKLQWYKLYYRNPIMHKCVDKYEVREYIKSKGLEDILNELYGVYDNPEEIDFNKLPKKFVIKDTIGSGGNSVIIVDNKNTANLTQIKKELKNWVKISSKRKNPGREWPYENQKHRIIIEKYIEANKEKGGLIDYKFFCNNGEPYYLYVITDRTLGGISNFGIYDSNFKRLEVKRLNEKEGINRKIIKPSNFDEMKEIARKLSNDFPHARIDLYNNNGKIIFGEITFYNASGYMKYDPDEFDYKLGENFKLQNFNK